MTMGSVAHRAWAPPATAGNDGATELEARKRRIIRRGPLGNAASNASQATLVEAGTIQRVEKGRLLIAQGDAAANVAMLGMGRVRLTRVLGDTRSLSIGYRGAGDILGAWFILLPFGSTAVTLDLSRHGRMPRSLAIAHAAAAFAVVVILLSIWTDSPLGALIYPRVPYALPWVPYALTWMGIGLSLVRGRPVMNQRSAIGPPNPT